MSASPATRRAVAEIDFGEGANATFKVGNRSIHQFWHLFSSHFRHVLLAPQRRADSGKVAWTWREAGEKRPVTATELVEVRRRLSEAGRSLTGGFGGIGRRDDDDASSLEGQVRATVGEMVGQLVAQRDSTLAGFVCRSDAGLMLHSWGAAMAAEPYFPDAPHGEISGTVFVGVEPAAGVTVTLENTQGIGGARVKSDRDGVFRFPSVAPGSYRLRVADRGDFPGGLTVEIERESIAGLELRSASDEPLSMAGRIAPVAENVSWFRRPWMLASFILVLGAGMMAWWRSQRPSDAPAVARNQSSSWQSAKGQLAANNPQTPANDDHRVGHEGAFSTLSNSIPPPKILRPQIAHASAGAGTAGSDHAPQPSENSAAAGQRPEDTFPPSDSKGKPISSASSLPQAKRDLPDLSVGQAREKMRPSQEASGAIADDEQSKPEKEKPAKSSRAVTDDKKSGISGAAVSASEESRSADTALAESNASTDPALAIVPGSKDGKSPQRGGAKSLAASGAVTKNAGTSTSSADTEASDSNAPGAAAAINGKSETSLGGSADESAKNSPPNGTVAAAAAPVEPSEAVSAGNTADASMSPEPATRNGAEKNPRPAKTNPANQKLPQPESSALPESENGADLGTPVASASREKAAQPSVDAEKKSVPTKETNERPDWTAEADADQSTAVQSPGGHGPAPSVRHSKPARKSAAGSSSEPDEQSHSAEADSTADSTVTAPVSSTFVGAGKGDESLLAMGKLRASAWRKRIVRDVIVPTRPVSEAEEETMEMLREKLRQEQATRMPKAFREPRMHGGIVVEFPAAAEGRNFSRWRNQAGAEPSGASVTAQRAELSWTNGVPPPNANYTLSDSNGGVIAVVNVDGSGAFDVKTTANARVSYWCGIERTPVRSKDDAKNRGRPFEWELFSGAAIPSSWVRDDHWLNGHGQRLDIPLDATTRRVGNYQVALIDPATGWAIVSDLSVLAP